jgi:hypothetical protein
MNILQHTLSALTVGAPQQFDNLTVIPLIGSSEGEASYDTLDEALRTERLRVTETSDAGSVPEIKVSNGGDRPVLIIDGEELVGAKQNRTVNLTILVPARSEVIVPVTCVEAGRWHARSVQFASAARTHFAEGRAAKSRQVTRSLLDHGIPVADQGQVWDAISAKAARLQARSETGAMADLFEKYTASVDAHVDAIRVVAGQRGAVFLIDRRPVGLDLFDCARTLKALFPKLVRGYAIDAIDRCGSVGGPAGDDTVDRVSRFLSEATELESKAFPAIGVGESWRFTSPTLSGGGLDVSGTLVHLSVFRD